MGKLKVIGLAALIIIHSACGSNENQNQNSSQMAPAENQEQSIPKLGDFMKSYDGTIDGKNAITMKLTKIGSQLYGAYAYKSINKPILIAGNCDENGTFVITEYTPENVITGSFEGKLEGTSLTGNWKSGNGKRVLPFTASETSSTTNEAEIQKIFVAESTNEIGDGIEPELVYSAIYKRFKSVSTGNANMNGRYDYWERQLFQVQEGNKYKMVKNSVLFNDGNGELINRINAELKKQYDSYSKDGALEGCYDGKPFKSFKMDELGIEFNEKEMVFYAEFGYMSACAAVNEGIVSIGLNDLQKYIVE